MINAPAYFHKGVMIPYSVVEVPVGAEGSLSGKTPVVLSFLNYSDRYMYLKKGHIIGNAEEVDRNQVWTQQRLSLVSGIC